MVNRAKVDKLIFSNKTLKIKADPDIKEKKLLGVKHAFRLDIQAAGHIEKIYFRPKDLNMATNLLSKIEYAQECHLAGFYNSFPVYVPSDIPITKGSLPKCDRVNCKKLFHGVRMQGYKCINRNIYLHKDCLKPVMHYNEKVEEIFNDYSVGHPTYADLEDSFDASFISETSFDNSPLPLQYQPYYRPTYDRTDANNFLKRCNNGEFVIRERTDTDDGSPFALSLNSRGKILHAKIGKTKNGDFHLDGQKTFISVVEMIDYYQMNGIGNTIKGRANSKFEFLTETNGLNNNQLDSAAQ